MGFFSWNCKCCGKSIVSPYSPKEIDWMNKITMVLDTGEVIQGKYDGYGDIYSRTDEHAYGDNWDIDENAESICLDNEHRATFYHTACYEENNQLDFKVKMILHVTKDFSWTKRIMLIAFLLMRHESTSKSNTTSIFRVFSRI